ncbi:MAG TPA: adenosine deaminase [Candidatus Angelobacter sp.]|nr:adenosine deaminase [Candidatus Angelobacter sp.]
MKPSALSERIASLRKAELHLHLEGSIAPSTVCALAARHGIGLTEEEAHSRYSYENFMGFIEAFKWVTSFLREPQDYALIAQALAEHLLTQNVVYAEVILSVGVMLLRKQQPAASFEALLRATEPFERRGLRLRWIFDAVRQFGPDAAMAVVESAKSCGSNTIVAFGIGGDELSNPTAEFRAVYDRAREIGLHCLIHAGEIGGPEKIREAIEVLGAERIGHGIAAIHDRALMDLLAEKKIPLEICPGSNLRTGALARQVCRNNAKIEDHPLPSLLRHGIPVVLSTDDPAMFQTTLHDEYANAARMGLREDELARLVQMGFEYAFLPAAEKQGA